MTTSLERLEALKSTTTTGRNLIGLSDTELAEARAEAVAEAKRIAETGVKHNRDLTPGEHAAFDAAIEVAEGCDHVRAVRDGAGRATELRDSFREVTGHDPYKAATHLGSPLALDRDVLDALEAAVRSRSPGRFGMAPELRAALSTTNTSGRQTWSANQVAGPRLLHVVAGVPSDLATGAIIANYLKAGAIAATGSVGENVSTSEFTSVTPASATLARFGRYSSLSREADIASEGAATLAGAHRRGVARDLDNLLIQAVTGVAATGTVTGTDGLRVAQATIGDSVGVEENGLTIVVHPGKAAVVADVSPVGGATLAETTPLFAGSAVYFSSLAPPGSAVVFAGSSVRYFEAAAFLMETDHDVKTATLTIASSVIAAYGVDLINGGARLVTL